MTASEDSSMACSGQSSNVCTTISVLLLVTVTDFWEKLHPERARLAVTGEDWGFCRFGTQFELFFCSLVLLWVRLGAIDASHIGDY